MPTDQPVVRRETPEGLETKDTRGALLGYEPSQVPHLDRTGSALGDDERRRADQHGDLAHGGSGMPEADADRVGGVGMTSESGGTQSRPATSGTRRASTKDSGTKDGQ
jgi:hypothetical protein